jgi:hypothetical protein
MSLDGKCCNFTTPRKVDNKTVWAYNRILDSQTTGAFYEDLHRSHGQLQHEQRHLPHCG